MCFLARTSASRTRIFHCCCNIENQDLKGQTVAILGLGVSGRAAARLALARGASVLAIDKNENMASMEHDHLFKKQSDVRTILGYCDRKLLEDADRVVVSPGVPLQNYGISSLLQSGRQVMSELDFAAEVLPRSIKVLAVTGTNGKSTVTTFAGQMLYQLGVKAFVGGNLGKPLSEAAIQCFTSSSVDVEFQVAVVEVSSYQMEIPNTYFCPSVGVVLNLTPDHLERHKTMEKYATAKCSLFSHMNNEKLAVLPVGNEHLNEAFKDHVHNCNPAWIGDFPGVKIDFEEKIAYLKLPSSGVVTQLKLGGMKAIGTHNNHNAAVAAFSILGLDVGIDPGAISATLSALKSPPHRMQIVHRDSCEVTWIDDSKATNVEATYAGLMGLGEQKSVVLLGGLAKVLNAEGSNGFEKLVEPLKKHRCVITFGSSGREIQKTLFAGGLSIPCHRAKSMENAVNLAVKMAGYGDAIILSPGCASFDEFRSFEHRGKIFQELAFSCSSSG